MTTHDASSFQLHETKHFKDTKVIRTHELKQYCSNLTEVVMSKSVQVQKRWKSLLKTCLLSISEKKNTTIYNHTERCARKSYLFERNKLACFVYSSMYVLIASIPTLSNEWQYFHQLIKGDLILQLWVFNNVQQYNIDILFFLWRKLLAISSISPLSISTWKRPHL